MSDLRERFRVLDEVPVPDRIVSLPPIPVSGGRAAGALRRTATVAAAALVAVASFAILVRAFRSGPPPNEPAAGPFSVQVGSPIEVGDAPNAVAVGSGAVWVSAHPADGPPYELVRLDAVRGDVEARIRVPGLPTWEVGGGGLLARDGVWVTSAVDPGRAILFRVDPITDEVAERIDLGPGFGADVWIDDTGVWVLLFDGGADPGVSVARLDPLSFDEVARIPLPTTWAKQVFAYDGSIWVHGNSEGASEDVVPDVLFRIDPATNRYVGRFDLPSREFSLAVDGSSIWQRTAEGVARIDPAGAPIRVPVDGMEEFCCSHIASDGAGGVWAVSRGEAGRIQVVHVTRDGEIDGRGEAEVPASVLESVAIAFDREHRTLWLTQYQDTVVPLRLVPS